jgi:hypothetical protein
MGDAQIRSHKHDHIRIFEVLVRVGRRIEADGLLVSGDRCGHALSRVTVAVHDAHAELGEAPQEGHFFGRHLASTEKRNRSRAVFALDGLKSLAKQAHRWIPCDGHEPSAGISHQWRCRAIGRLEDA